MTTVQVRPLSRAEAEASEADIEDLAALIGGVCAHPPGELVRADRFQDLRYAISHAAWRDAELVGMLLACRWSAEQANRDHARWAAELARSIPRPVTFIPGHRSPWTTSPFGPMRAARASAAGCSKPGCASPPPSPIVEVRRTGHWRRVPTMRPRNGCTPGTAFRWWASAGTAPSATS